jgi:isocitrate/isopropylmalate dehydrogenase
MATTIARVIVCDGDETGQELLDQSLRVMTGDLLGVSLQFEHFDLSLENRRATNNEVVREAAAAMVETGLGLKAATA